MFFANQNLRKVDFLYSSRKNSYQSFDSRNINDFDHPNKRYQTSVQSSTHNCLLFFSCFKSVFDKLQQKFFPKKNSTRPLPMMPNWWYYSSLLRCYNVIWWRIQYYWYHYINFFVLSSIRKARSVSILTQLTSPPDIVHFTDRQFNAQSNSCAFSTSKANHSQNLKNALPSSSFVLILRQLKLHLAL